MRLKTLFIFVVVMAGCGQPERPPEHNHRKLDVQVVPDGGRGGGRIRVDVDKDGRPIIDVDIQREQRK